MAINKNHEFEELDGVKCSIVEKNASPARVAFLKKLLEYNKFVVVVVPSPAPKPTAAPPKPAAPATESNVTSPATPQEGQGVAPSPTTNESPIIPPAPLPETYTIGVTDYTFNPINAIFGRLLKTPDGHVVTQAYWNQKEDVSDDEVPYYEKN